uniref:Uncharacterized protein n=1 Tax=Anguilla anguilla TaxID=7936 RepID=A0A0E9VMS5_ANGAN
MCQRVISLSSNRCEPLLQSCVAFGNDCDRRLNVPKQRDSLCGPE